MKLKLKNYKTKKIKKYVQTSQLFFFFHGINLTITNWIVVKQLLKKLKLTHYRLTNNLLKLLVTKSILKNFKSIIKGPCFFMKLLFYNYKTLVVLQNLLDFTCLLTFFCLKFNNKVYTAEQLYQIKFLNYSNCIKNLQYLLQNFLYHTMKIFNK